MMVWRDRHLPKLIGCDSRDANGWRKSGTGNPPSCPAMTIFRGGGGIAAATIIVSGGLLIPRGRFAIRAAAAFISN